MRNLSLSRRFFFLVTAIFAMIIFAAVRLTRQLSQDSAEGARRTMNLRAAIQLNQELREGINHQLNQLFDQFILVDIDFPRSFSQINYLLGSKQTQYLRLNIDARERSIVEEIKSLQSELGVQALQIYGQLREGRREIAIRRFSKVDDLADQIDVHFVALNALQIAKVQSALTHLNNSIDDANLWILGLTGTFLLVLGLGAYGIRRNVLRPLESIQQASDRIRLGDFSARAEVKGNDEIGRLAQGFNYMAESLAGSYEVLEQKVAERTRELQKLQQQLVQSERLSAVGQLVGGVAHELNNPLTVILGFTELARMEMAERDADPRDIQLVADIQQHADRCRRIVANLIQFARRREARFEPIHVNETVERAVRLREYDLGTRNVRLIRDYDPSDPVISADPQKIQQVVVSLLNNSYDAINDRGGAGTISITTRAGEESVRLEIRDNGTGIADLDRVFEPFYTTKEVGKGVGLGLSVCYGIVQEHRGRIIAENWQEGARIEVTLPVGNIEEPAPSVEPGAAERAPATARREALIVDDEEPVLRLQHSFLRRMGIHAVGVGSGQDAANFLREHDVDLIITDIRMPGMLDGLGLYEWVRVNKPALAKKFLFTSGDLIGIHSGNVDSSVPRLQKPFKFEEYSRTIRQILHDGAPA